jgi:hypothetical protein
MKLNYWGNCKSLFGGFAIAPLNFASAHPVLDASIRGITGELAHGVQFINMS